MAMLLLSAEYSPSGAEPAGGEEPEGPAEPVMAASCALPSTPATSAS